MRPLWRAASRRQHRCARIIADKLTISLSLSVARIVQSASDTSPSFEVSVSDGLHIRWRETAPDRGLLSFALSELEALHSTWPETLQCNIVIERAPSEHGHGQFHTHVELDLGRRSPRVRAKALSPDVYVALHSAFRDLRSSMPRRAGDDVAA